MRTASFLATVALSLTAALPAAQAAGTVQVSFLNTQQYTDAGFGARELARCTDALGEHLKGLAARLPDGQLLKVQITNIDLAGEIHPNLARGDLRVLRGAADWPQIELTYTLEQGGRTLQSGPAKLADMAYMMSAFKLRRNEEFAYEKRLLTRWVDELNAPKMAH